MRKDLDPGGFGVRWVLFSKAEGAVQDAWPLGDVLLIDVAATADQDSATQIPELVLVCSETPSRFPILHVCILVFV